MACNWRSLVILLVSIYLSLTQARPAGSSLLYNEALSDANTLIGEVKNFLITCDMNNSAKECTLQFNNTLVKTCSTEYYLHGLRKIHDITAGTVQTIALEKSVKKWTLPEHSYISRDCSSPISPLEFMEKLKRIFQRLNSKAAIR